MNKLFAKKPLADVLAEVHADPGGSTVALKRQLGPIHLILLGIGVVIGAGLFSLTGKVAAESAGPAVTLSYIIGGFACALAGLCYAEFASMVPASGSAYTYSYVTLGELFAWIIGWDLVLEYAVGAATVATAWSAYFMKLCHQIGFHFPHALAASPFDENPGIMNLPAAFIILAMSALLIKGTKESAIFNAVMVVLKVIIVLTVVGLGWAYINPANHTPFIPANTGTFGEFGWSGIMRGAGLIFFAYIGFDAVSTCAAEAVAPERTVPLGILGLPSRTRVYTHAYHCCSDAPDTRQHGPSARSKPSTFSNHIVCVLASVHRAPHRPPTTQLSPVKRRCDPHRG